MQDYTDYANKNGVTLIEEGKCQFCGANVKKGIKDCVDIFNQGFEYNHPLAIIEKNNRSRWEHLAKKYWEVTMH